MTPYPTTLPIVDVQLIIADIRGGQIVADKQNFAKAVWEVLGYALESAFGDPTPTGLRATASAPLTDEQAANMLECACKNAELPPGTAGAINIDWQALIQWALQLLAGLITK